MDNLWICSVVSTHTPLKNMGSSIGMMTFSTEWKNNPNVPNHQPVDFFPGGKWMDDIFGESKSKCCSRWPIEIIEMLEEFVFYL